MDILRVGCCSPRWKELWQQAWVVRLKSCSNAEQANHIKGFAPVACVTTSNGVPRLKKITDNEFPFLFNDSKNTLSLKDWEKKEVNFSTWRVHMIYRPPRPAVNWLANVCGLSGDRHNNCRCQYGLTTSQWVPSQTEMSRCHPLAYAII